MARQANGTYIQPANTAAVSGQTISSTAFNTLITDVGTEITNSLDRQGRSAMQAALPMGNNKITGLATPTAATDAATKAYVDTVPLVDKSVTLQKLYHPTSTSKLLGSDAAAALSITAAVNNGSGLIRLTVASTATFATGQKKTVSDVVGTTEANGTWTITVVDGTHIDLQGSTFTNLYVSGGTIGGGIAEISLGAGLSISGQSLISNPAGAWNYLSGLTMSTAGSSATMSIAAGVASDTTNTTIMTLAATSKTTASWAVGSGNGGLDSGSIANNTWYHFYVIQRPDTGVVDVLFSQNGSTPPTLPTNYTLYRRIGCGRTNGSGQWVAFTQFGDDFLWLVPTADIATTTLGASPTTFGLTVPTGVKVIAQLTGFFSNASAGTQLLIQSPDVTGAGPSGVSGLVTARIISGGVGVAIGHLTIRTNIFAQIVAYADTASSTLNISTRGWTDLRGKI